MIRFPAVGNRAFGTAATRNPGGLNRVYTDKTRLRGLKIPPHDFQSPNTLFVRLRGHRLCRRGFQPPGFPTAG